MLLTWILQKMPQRKNSELLTKTAADENLPDFLPDWGGVGSPRSRAPLLWPARGRAPLLFRTRTVAKLKFKATQLRFKLLAKEIATTGDMQGPPGAHGVRSGSKSIGNISF